MTYKDGFIDFMARAGVLTFGDFITKSGRRTPYFINTGNYRTGGQMAQLGKYYAHCIRESGEQFDVMFGPAYKGIPLCIAAGAALYAEFGLDLPWCFNRKEAKDHGEGGGLVGAKPRAGDRVAVIEDVVTAGTAVRETLSILAPTGAKVTALFVSVDRMERGQGSLSALDELRETFGIAVHPIVTVREIMTSLHGRELDGRVVLDDATLAAMEGYLQTYGAG